MTGTDEAGQRPWLTWKWTPVATAALGGLLLLPWIGRVPLLDADEDRKSVV